MEKYLVFKLERDYYAMMCTQEGVKETHVVEPCFELVKEFEVVERVSNYQYVKVVEWARDYSSDHKVRTLVIKGSVFGG